ncbi:4-hydroxy-tetrahydrodipicolinate reductase [Ferroacidibacillus organovorans]|uniref:4-hydroxy-tetrahydrodipicolinate reductase n=1 Tax=Ferroacidibacillus organovorans TaxID=1765683 RepID=A0A162TN45_9BACL|nr:4-hydroxy-tetrahydrodipicolinate reductase [Ferroacidibacillus organovorans]KYP80959.1 hypothetical protein AYJ22_09565 [Ferroacidibacillus organovorans]OAG93663.1 hypothetical protein AYW79_09505 [Ferroacidibacillus organovorans]OPG16530.1 4-hydroxy-tetrahydrodipicolinate reductase [Ferroacidibacillus organovorans]
MIRTAVAGPRGKMGRETVRALMQAEDLELVALLDRKADPQDAMIPVYDDPLQCFLTERVDVVVDFTHADASRAIIPRAIEAGVSPVIGTTGFRDDELEAYDRALKNAGIGGLYVPNFAIGAILMMQMAEIASRFFDHVEIIEYHHEQKRDAPSGTAKRTAERIEQALDQRYRARTTRESPRKIPIHSVRLPGFIAHQEVIFGGDGERFTLRHDSMSRESFMQGVLLSVRNVQALTGLTVGLDHLLR